MQESFNNVTSTLPATTIAGTVIHEVTSKVHTSKQDRTIIRRDRHLTLAGVLVYVEYAIFSQEMNYKQ